MMRTQRFNIRLSDQELELLSRRSEKACLSRSDYFRVVLQQRPIPSISVSKKLFKANADLARLGNLLLMVMNQLADSDISDRNIIVEDMNNLKNEIRQRQSELKVEIQKIKT